VKFTKGALTVALAAISAALVIVPLAIDQPFGAQTEDTMRLAYALRHWSPIVTAAIAIVTVALVVGLMRRARWWARALWAIPPVVAIAAAWLAWQNPFEWMFNPLPQPQFVTAAKATFVEPDDLVLAVSGDGDAAAYPIRQMAYHHLVNDRIGRTPAVVTY
jgi:hypothetical protein